MGSVQLIQGDLFSGPTDLIVLPCSVDGNITPFVRRRLTTFNLPYPERRPLGSVQIQRFEHAENIAAFVAFATSVRSRSSDPRAIGEIGRRLGAATRQLPAVQAVSAPLLGAGAGHLDSRIVVERLRDGFLAESSRLANLKIFVRWEDVYAQLVEHFSADQGGVQRVDPRGQAQRAGPMRRPARVFISHTSASEEDREWVEGLALFLRDQGINVRFDRWHLELGMNVTQWMINELDQADRVLLICNEAYAQRADRLHGGVGWEFMVIQGDLNFHRETTKYIAVVRSADIERGLPILLRAFYALHRPSGADVATLRRRLLVALHRTQVDARPREPAASTFI
jgi:TIR domain